MKDKQPLVCPGNRDHRAPKGHWAVGLMVDALAGCLGAPFILLPPGCAWPLAANTSWEPHCSWGLIQELVPTRRRGQHEVPCWHCRGGHSRKALDFKEIPV